MLLSRTGAISPLQYFQNISTFKSQITYSFVKSGCLIYFCPNSANLICRSTDISKYFRVSLDFEIMRVDCNNNNDNNNYNKEVTIIIIIIIIIITFTMLRTNSAHGRLMILFLFFLENRI